MNETLERTRAGETFGTFFLRDQEYAFAASQVREVVPFPQQLTALPLTDDRVEGLFTLRGEVIPLLEAGELLGVERNPDSETRRVVVIDAGGHRVGFAFDRTGEVLRPAVEDVKRVETDDPDGALAVVGALRADNGERFIQLLSVASDVELTPAEEPEIEIAETEVTERALVVRVADHEIAFRLEEVREVQAGLPTTACLEFFRFCIATVSLRNGEHAVLDVRSALGLTPAQEPQVLVFIRHGEDVIALAVDSLVETTELPVDRLSELPPLPDSALKSICEGVISRGDGRHILLGSSERIFTSMEVSLGLRALGAPALETAKQVQIEEEITLFTFRIGEFSFALPMEVVREVQGPPKRMATTRSGAPDEVGVLDVRGMIVPLIHMGTRLDVPVDDSTPGCVVVAIRSDGTPHGLIIDAIEQIVRIAPSRIRETRHLMQSESRTEALMRHLDRAILLPDDSGPMRAALLLDPLALERA